MLCSPLNAVPEVPVSRCAPRSAPLVAVALWGALAGGCDPDCSSPARIDGSYDALARSRTDRWQVSGFDPDSGVEEQLAQAELLSQVPLNGPRALTLKYVPGDQSYTLTLDGQRFVAQATPGKDNCNELALDLSGTFEGEAGSVHTFTVEGALLWTGDGLSGSYAYADTFVWGDRSGAVQLPDGELTADLVE